MASPNKFLSEATICFLMGLMLISKSHAAQLFRPSYTSRSDFVSAHNGVRLAVGVGPVVWNRTLAGYARAFARQRMAAGCGMEHSNGPYGENLAAGWGYMTGGDAVRFWATERFSYHPDSNSCLGANVCGHYTQIVWRDSVRIGCARAKCSNGWMFVICNYDPPGNYMGQRPY